MKNFFKVFILAFIVMMTASSQNEGKAQVSVNVSFQSFYDELSPYGQWIDYPGYGYVWSPGNRYSGFHPYRTGGHWVWSDNYEWMWVSDYDWGWAPFHYGRWLYDSFYGWVWIPGYDWSPAWVVWRGGGDYYGWAPMSPGINVNLYFGRHSVPSNYWCFAPRRYINSSRISSYYIDAHQNNTIINNTTIINNYSTSDNIYRTGPLRNEAEQYTGRIEPVRIRESERPGRSRFRNNEITMYKPSISGESKDIAPRRFEKYKGRERNDIIPEGRPQQKVELKEQQEQIEKPLQQERTERPQQRIERPIQQERGERPKQRIDRPVQQERIERPQQRIERPVQQERIERPQQRIERPVQQERIERPQQKIERPVQQERVERPQQRIERPVQQERIERPQQQIERPQPQVPNNPQPGSNRGRRNNGNE